MQECRNCLLTELSRVGDNETISGKKSQLSESLTKVYRSGGWGAREKATYRSV